MNPAVRPAACPTLPYLEHFPERGEAPHRILLDQLPFRIGRSMAAQYVIYSRQVSKEHTEIYRAGQEYRIRDLGSTNGTFVNGQRVGDGPLAGGDIIHVAHKEFRFGFEADEQPGEADRCFTEVAQAKVPASVIRGSMLLRELLNERSVRALFQPIVFLDSERVMGYEALGRGDHAELSPDPTELFDLASQCRLSGELSRVFRQAAAAEAHRLPCGPRIFFNVHPGEMVRDTLCESLRRLKAALDGGQQIVLEVHEGAAADLATMGWLRQHLTELGMGLAYDDFGSGQSRLQELAEVPPDYVKLDRCLVHHIDQAGPRQELVQALCRCILDMGVQVIAEGIERPEEARFFRELGCPFGQGFLFGRPQPLALACRGSKPRLV
jgi:EAL domain-containing protein (putative c-di-GMP-specific phosphodiesterase class I)